VSQPGQADDIERRSCCPSTHLNDASIIGIGIKDLVLEAPGHLD
jgi:hypothetical protein